MDRYTSFVKTKGQKYWISCNGDGYVDNIPITMLQEAPIEDLPVLLAQYRDSPVAVDIIQKRLQED